MSSILIAGCGYLGVRLGAVWASRGEMVYGLRRSATGSQKIPLPLTIVRVPADLTRPETLKPLPSVDRVVFCQAPGRYDAYEKTYLEGTRNLLEALKDQTVPPQLIFVSSTSVYSTTDGSWVDEGTDPRVPGHADDDARQRAETLLAAESAVLNSHFPSNIVRSSGIYGPLRNRVDAILNGSFVPELSEEMTNRVRVEDLADAIICVAEKGKNGQRYVVSDDCPTVQREFYAWLYGKLGKPLPEGGGDSMRRHGGNKRCQNAKIKELGWKPKYPSYKEGYADLLTAVS